MKKPYVMFVLLLTMAGSAFAQQPAAPASEETQRRLRRTETRTTTTKLYPERDSIVSLLKTRMAVLNSGDGAGGNLTSWFTPEAKISGADGSSKTPAEYQSTEGKIKYQNYRVRKLEINENTAQSVEVYSFVPSTGTAATPKTATATSQLRKDADGRWRITEMKVTTK